MVSRGGLACITLVATDLDRAEAYTEVTDLQIKGVLVEWDRIPAVDLIKAKQAVVLLPTGNTKEPLPLYG